ncbi:MAG: hypothetical protein CSA38_03170 [Flavobacteriales bacterium]|nr:MAG: hypothetical protein CSA38_03170 [Flavobacteriales bacterium]
MTTLPYKNLLFVFFLIFVFSCEKQNEAPLSLEKVKYNTNTSLYPQQKRDSLQAIEEITKQKLQQVIDLSVLYSKSNKDSEIDSTLYRQMLSYFYEPDSTTLKPLIKEMDSLKCERVEIENFVVKKRMTEKDTLNFAQFQLHYVEKRTKIDHEIQYILVSTPIQFKKEFKFYFLNYFSEPIKDSTRLGVIK